MACDCIEKLKENLKVEYRNIGVEIIGDIKLDWAIDPMKTKEENEKAQGLRIPFEFQEQKQTKRGKVKLVTHKRIMYLKFCPFCGKKSYEGK